MDLYDCTLGLLRVGPYHYPPLRGVDLWLQQVITTLHSQNYSVVALLILW